MRPPPGRLLVVYATLVFVGGCATGGCVGFSATPFDAGKAVYARLPHHVAPAPDAASFRFAMVHDVIHERYPRHGPAFYQERERLAREKMAVLHPDSEAAFAFMDDIAVGLDRRGRTDEAVALMRDKLKRQQAFNLPAKDLYSTYANLGEFLVHANLMPMLGGDAAARERFREGRGYLRKALDANPKAHFGREEWQLVAVDFLLGAGSRPESLRESDLIGNQLNIEINVPRERRGTAPFEDTEAVFGRPYLFDFGEVLYSGRQEHTYEVWLKDPERRADVRKFIYPVGGETPMGGKKENARGRRAPFDEPALWLVGEWRQGSGPSPHLALCIGEIMLRVGQRFLAWNCYERAARLADHFSPKEDSRRALRDHCRGRQAAIEKSLPKDEVAELRPKFEAEVAFGESYQRDYQAYTEEKIKAGANLNDEHFFDEFHASRPPIASKVGPEEWYAGTNSGFGLVRKFGAFWEWGLLTGGTCVLLLALVVRSRVRRSPLRLTEVTPPP